MIELTTGVVFLMSSLYGSGQSTASISNVAHPLTQDNQVAAVAVADTSTSKIDQSAQVMKAYLEKEYADTPILIDVARCESNFHQFDKDGNIVRGMVNSADVGVMQINEIYHLGPARSMGLDLHTVEGNVAYAKKLYKEQGTAPWKSSSKCWGSSDQLAQK